MNLPRFRTRTILVALTLLASLVAVTPAASARDTTVTSFDGTKLVVHFFPADGLAPGESAPVVLLAHGFGESGPDSPDAQRLVGAPPVSRLLDAGYNVLTWDARGHGESGGSAMLNSPDFELRDTMAIIDWVAEQPEVLLDAPGDPRLGMTGASYGGLIQFLTAAEDPRVDVITPAYTAHSLSSTSLARNGKFKEGWGLGLSGISLGNGPAGLRAPWAHNSISWTPRLPPDSPARSLPAS